jgi:hypothetical protein
MSEFDGLDQFETEGLLAGTRERNWIWFGLIVSLAIHFGLCAYFYRTRFAPAEAAVAQNEQTPMFKVRSITESNLDKSSADQTTQAAKPNPDNTDVQLPDEKKSFDKLLQDIQASAALPDDMRDVLPDQPKVEQPEVNSVLNEIDRSTAQTLSNDPSALHEQSLLNNSSTSGRPQPALSGTELATSTAIKRPNTFTSKLPGDSAGPNKGHTPGFSDLINAVAKRSLGSGTKLRLPDDQLFGMTAFCNPARLISRKSSALYSTQSRHLGRRLYRLVRHLRIQSRSEPAARRQREEISCRNDAINPAQIETHGYGATKFRASPNGSIEEQNQTPRGSRCTSEGDENRGLQIADFSPRHSPHAGVRGIESDAKTHRTQHFVRNVRNAFSVGEAECAGSSRRYFAVLTVAGLRIGRRAYQFLIHCGVIVSVPLEGGLVVRPAVLHRSKVGL